MERLKITQILFERIGQRKKKGEIIVDICGGDTNAAYNKLRSKGRLSDNLIEILDQSLATSGGAAMKYLSDGIKAWVSLSLLLNKQDGQRQNVGIRRYMPFRQGWDMTRRADLLASV